MREQWIDFHGELSITTQCRLAGVSRSTIYARKAPHHLVECNEDLLLKNLIDEKYTERPFYGSRRMREFLKTKGYIVNRKRVQRLMRDMNLAGMAPASV